MRIAIIGRTEVLYETSVKLRGAGHDIVGILTSKEAPEYTRKASDFRKLAALWNIPFVQDVKIANHINFFKELRADIALSVNYTSIIPQSIIDIFPLGILNAHGGDLPRYRGNACQAWAIINGEDRIGLCIHKMIGGELDSGDIITRDYLSIDDTTKITQVWDWITKKTPALMLEAIAKLDQDSHYILERQSTHPIDSLRCYPRIPDDARINWSMSAVDVLRLINASNKPYCGAFCFYGGEKLTIWDAELVYDQENICAIPGQVTKVSPDFIEVATTIGRIRLLHVEYQKTCDSPSKFITSIRSRLT